MSESGPSAASGVDRDALVRLRTVLRDQGDAVVGQLIGLFLEETVKRLESIERGLAEDDAQTVQLCAHSLRGSAALLGAHRLGDLSGSLGRAASEQRLSSVAPLVAEIQAEYANVARQLKESE